jgi:hypothetical protein
MRFLDLLPLDDFKGFTFDFFNTIVVGLFLMATEGYDCAAFACSCRSPNAVDIT